MASKLNIFNALPSQVSDDEDDRKGSQSKGGNNQPKKDRVRKKGTKNDNGPETRQVGKESHLPKDHKSRDHQLKKTSNDLDRPHALDRRSGTGEQAFGRQDKKGGAGRFNKGNFKDDMRPRGEGERDNESGDESPAEEEDNTVTMDDYLTKTGHESKQQVNEAKAKITDDQIKKELGKATLLQNRKDAVDDHCETVKKTKTSNFVGMNTEHADLLGFRTGFKVFDGPKKRPFEKTEKPTEKAEEGAEKTEEKKDEKPADDNTKDEESPNQRGGRGGRRGGYKGESRGGYKGDNRGGYKGDNRGGHKGDTRGGHKGPKATFNAEDDSLFPKLG